MRLIDFHTHIDYYNEPEKIIKEYEKRKIYTLFVTNLPEIYKNHLTHFIGYKYVRLALGYHPDLASSDEFKFDFNEFKRLSKFTSYIGEVGLDFSKYNLSSKPKQIEIFNKIVSFGANKEKLFSIHSRKAEKEVLDILLKYNVKNAIFHWYSGPLRLINEIVKNGYYFSVNSQMLSSISGQKILKKIPIDRIIIETDGPFTKYEKEIITPDKIENIYKDFSCFYQVKNFDEIVFENFREIIRKLRS